MRVGTHVGEGRARYAPHMSGRAYQCRGAHAIHTRDVIDSRLGAGTFAALVRDRGDEWQMLRPSDWMDMDVLLDVIRAAADRLKVPFPALVKDIGVANAKGELRGMYSVFLKLLKPRTVIGQLPTLWVRFFSFAAVTLVRNEPGHLIVEGRSVPARYAEWLLGGWPGFIGTAVSVAGGEDFEVVSSSIEPPLGNADEVTVCLEFRYD